MPVLRDFVENGIENSRYFLYFREEIPNLKLQRSSKFQYPSPKIGRICLAGQQHDCSRRVEARQYQTFSPSLVIPPAGVMEEREETADGRPTDHVGEPESARDG